MMSDKKIFRDPIYNLISFDKKEDKPIIEIINTPEFQRLKRIRQLGLSGYTFPTAVHDRFSHSLGTAYIVGELFDNIVIDEEIEIPTVKENGKTENINISKKQLRLLIQLAGLLHDIGHGPFSHAFEKINSVDHEQMSIKIIRSEINNISNILSSIEDKTLKKYSLKWIVDILQGTFEPIWVKELISSQLDADRIDYLLRDAYMCGVTYASFDIKWLFQNIEIAEIASENRMGLLINAQKGIHAVESFIVSRYHMYEQVYFHKTTRGFEIVVQRIFKRLKELLENNQLNDNFFIDSNLSDFINDNDNLKAYLMLDDFYLLTHFNHWINLNKDELLTELCKVIIYREPLKLIKEVKNESLWSTEESGNLLRKLGDYKEYYFEDDYKNVPYKDHYLLGKKSAESAEHIWLKTKKGQIDLAEMSPIISSLRNNELKKYRAYIHRNYLSKIEEVK